MIKRDINLDLIRVVATFCVLSVHFFLNNGFYDQIVIGKKMFLSTFMRSAFMICVPLFMILSGYLMNKKTISIKYFCNIKKVLSVYVLSMLLIILYRVFRYHEIFTFKDILYNILNYKYYAWYIEMYIGLYLLIPFINLVYNNLKSKNEKRALCGVLLFITAAPSLVNILLGIALIPNWWVNIYPITYYFIGAYISEYKDEIRLSLKMNFMLILFSFILAGTVSYVLSYNTYFIWGIWNDWGGFTNVLSTTLVFLFLVRIDISHLPTIIKRVIAFISVISLPTYLLSYIADDIWYPVLKANVIAPLDRVFYYIPMVILTFGTSVCFAYVIDKMNRLGNNLIGYFIKIVKRDIS